MDNSPIPFTTQGNGAPLVFLHANGYPPACYRQLISLLAHTHTVYAMEQRPLWPGSQPQEIADWQPLSDDLLRFLDARGLSEPVTVVGHSVGGIATLRAALRAPQRFRAVILLDPVLFSPAFIVAWNLIRALGLGYRLHPLIPLAQKRRRHFDNLERVFTGYRRRAPFKYFSDESLSDYIEGMTTQTADGGYTLRYSPEWETHIYITGVWRDLELWRALPTLQPPALILRGDETDTFFASTAQRVKRVNPRVNVETIAAATHLVPLERPGEVHQHITAFLNAL